jgi:hypothetical protein
MTKPSVEMFIHKFPLGFMPLDNKKNWMYVHTTLNNGNVPPRKTPNTMTRLYVTW